jgi:hypothetical protein
LSGNKDGIGWLRMMEPAAARFKANTEQGRLRFPSTVRLHPLKYHNGLPMINTKLPILWIGRSRKLSGLQFSVILARPGSFFKKDSRQAGMTSVWILSLERKEVMGWIFFPITEKEMLPISYY